MNKGHEGLTSFGLGLSDYQQMFDLTEPELEMHILDFRAGACAFCADMADRHNVIACDPVYAKTPEQINKLAIESSAILSEQFNKNPDSFKLSKEEFSKYLAKLKKGVTKFNQHYASKAENQIYFNYNLPKLNFINEQFDLALVSHFLFTYSDELNAREHIDIIKELLRVANEVRIFPLTSRFGGLSPLVGEVVSILQVEGVELEIRGVNYEVQKGANAMLRVWANECSVEAHNRI